MTEARRRRRRVVLNALVVVLLGPAGAVAAMRAPALDSGSSARADTTYTDMTGDGGTAPDIVRVVVSHTEGGRITFHLDTPGAPILPADVVVYIGIDADRRLTTGSPAHVGAEYVLAAQGRDRSVWLQRWTGAALGAWEPVAGSFSDGDGPSISVSNTAIGGTTAFGFWVSTQLGAGGTGHVDFAPNAGTWTYTLAAEPPTTPTTATTRPTTTRPTTTRPKPEPKPVRTISSLKVLQRPAAPTAGATFRLSVPAIVWSTGASEKPDSFTCAAKLGGTALKGSGAGGCTFRLPKAAGGKRLAVRVTARCDAKVRSRTVAYTVRAAPKPPATKPKPPTTTTRPTTTTGGPSRTIETVVGRMKVAGAQFRTEEGARVLAVLLARPDGKDIDAGIGVLLLNEGFRDGAYVVAPGAPRAPFLGKVVLEGPKLALLFGPVKTGTHGYKLFWPDNPPVDVGL